MSGLLRQAAIALLGSTLPTSQLETLIALLIGLVNGGQAGIAAIGAKMLGEAQDKSKKNRVYRFVSNPRVSVEGICDAIVAALGIVGKRVVVATDWTDIGHLAVLASAVVTDARAIPIFWTVIDTRVTRKAAVEVEHMRRLSQMLTGVDAVHVLDRGFDCGEFLKAIGGFCKYVVRLSRGFCYRKPEAVDFKSIDDFAIKRGRRHDLGEVAYTKAHATKCRLVLLHDHLQKEPWLLATNRYRDDRAAIVGYYACRFRIEESFRDLKALRTGFGLNGYRMKNPEHLARLLAVVAVGYLLVTAGGHYGEERGTHRAMQSNTRLERELASWRVGLRLIQENSVSSQEVVVRATRLAACVRVLDSGSGLEDEDAEAA